MEEIEDRFQMIRLAVNLADFETMEIQIRRLRNLSTDKHLHEILQDLESRNFRQALYLMRNYATSLKDEFFSPSLSDPESATDVQPVKREAPPTPVEQDLFAAPSAPQMQGSERMLGLDEMLKMTKESAPRPRQYTQIQEDTVDEKPTAMKREESVSPDVEPDPLFTLDQDAPYHHDSVTTDTDIPDDTQEHRATARVEEPAPGAALDMTPLFGGGEDLNNDDMLSLSPFGAEAVQSLDEKTPKELEKPNDIFASDTFAVDETKTLFMDKDEPEVSDQEPLMEHQTPLPVTDEEEIEKETLSYHDPETKFESDPMHEPEREAEPEPEGEEPSRPRRWEIESDDDGIQYAKFAYMGQKFRNMMHQYPQLEEYEGGVMEEVRDFIHMVSTRDYTERQIEAVIDRYQELKEQGKRAEAAQMLIVAATTESTFAQFMLARELFKGEVLKQDYPESFTQINRLAEEDYPEAICDLGQLYEYGIGIDKNKRHALLLYEEAAEMGVDRAKGHYDRLKNTNPIQSIKSLTSSLLRKKK
jgi:hypothetical protein